MCGCEVALQAVFFFITDAYSAIAGRTVRPPLQSPACSTFSLLWKSFAPLKAQITAWRLLHDRLLTRDKQTLLTCTGIAFLLHYNQQPETTCHFFLHCNEVFRLWDKVSNWIDVSWAPANSIVAHFLQFAGLIGGSKFRKLLGVLLICAVWVL